MSNTQNRTLRVGSVHNIWKFAYACGYETDEQIAIVLYAQGTILVMEKNPVRDELSIRTYEESWAARSICRSQTGKPKVCECV